MLCRESQLAANLVKRSHGVLDVLVSALDEAFPETLRVEDDALFAVACGTAVKETLRDAGGIAVQVDAHDLKVGYLGGRAVEEQDERLVLAVLGDEELKLDANVALRHGPG